MTYTNEEIKIIKNNIKKVETFCKTEIIPLLTENLYVDFSEIQYRRDGSSFKKTYLFCIETNGNIKFVSSALDIVFDEKHEPTNYSVNAYTRWNYTEALFERWYIVKRKIYEEISKQQTKRSALLNFQI